MSLPAAPLVPTANNPQSVGHPDTVSTRITAINGIPGQSTSVRVVQTDLTTPGSSAVLTVSGGLGTGGGTGGSEYQFIKGCGPSAGGIVTDHLQLFRYGPQGAVAPLSQVLDIAPKLVADSLPAGDIVNFSSDVRTSSVSAPLTTDLRLFAGFPSFASPPGNPTFAPMVSSSLLCNGIAQPVPIIVDFMFQNSGAPKRSANPRTFLVTVVADYDATANGGSGPFLNSQQLPFAAALILLPGNQTNSNASGLPQIINLGAGNGMSAFSYPSQPSGTNEVLITPPSFAGITTLSPTCKTTVICLS